MNENKYRKLLQFHFIKCYLLVIFPKQRNTKGEGKEDAWGSYTRAPRILNLGTRRKWVAKVMLRPLIPGE